MKIIALGDTHGRTDWERIVSKETFDKIIFIGDYFDTHESISPAQQIYNFTNIIAYKKANMDKVVLLIGNHDYHYIKGIDETYSGYQPLHRFDISNIIHEALDEKLLQMSFVHDNLLFTHAGVTNTWLRNHGYAFDGQLEKFINELFIYKLLSFRFQMGKNSSVYGDDIEQSPIWVRRESLLKDMVEGYTCVVGHSTVPKLNITNKLIMIDCLGTSGEYLIYDDSKEKQLTIGN